MINSNELFYVDKSVKKTPFPGKEYAIETMDMLNEAYQMYKDIFMDNEYKLKLSNGEIIDFKIHEKTLASLLGLETQYLISEPMQMTIENILGMDFNNKKRAFDYLRRIIERAEDVIKNDSKDYNPKILNYYRVMLKSIIFLGLPGFDKFDYGIIENKNLEHCVNGYNSKYFYVKSNEQLTPYFLMSLRFDIHEGVYVPTTILAMRNIGGFIDKNEFLLPLSLTTKYYGNIGRIEATPIEKIKLLSQYRDEINKHHANTKVNLDGISLVKKR